MPRHLHAVGAGETPAAPKSLVAATELDRRAFLVKSRQTIAKTIDDGVPAHALARLISEMNTIDAEIRRLDETPDAPSSAGAREPRSFDASAL